MTHEKLEIIIPTWNRAKYLERTLSQFKKSPFFNYKITIIDNDSTDNTQEICQKYKEIFPNLNIIKNKRNIGLSANILRCYEIADAEYLWLVGDNDNYDFSDCSEVIEAIENSKFDLIFVQGNDETNLRKTTIHEAYELGYTREIIGLINTISAYILKTELITSEWIQKGYEIAKYLYPQTALMKKACEEDFTLLISSKRIRIADDNPNVTYNTLELINGWVSSSLILEKKYRDELIKYFLERKMITIILTSIFVAKAKKMHNYRKTMNELIITIFYAKGILKGLIYSVLMIIISLTPNKLAKIILNKYHEKNNLPLIE